MQKFRICVTETSKVWYTIEAESKEDAVRRFSDWLDEDYDHQDAVCNALSRDGYEGLNYTAEDAPNDEEVDIRF